MSNAYRTGIQGTVTVNGTEYPITGWSIAPDATIIPFVNSKSGGHPVRSSTITDGGRFSFGYDWSDSNNPFGTPISLRVGATITNVKLCIDGPAGSLYWSIPSAIVQSTPGQIEVAGRFVNSVVCMVDGQFAPPGQSLF